MRNPFAVGAVGAFIAAVRFTPGASLPERLFNVLAGSFSAGIVTPALMEWLGVASMSYANAAAFGVGLVGMTLAAALLKGIKETPLGTIVTSWLSRWTPPPPPSDK